VREQIAERVEALGNVASSDRDSKVGSRGAKFVGDAHEGRRADEHGGRAVGEHARQLPAPNPSVKWNDDCSGTEYAVESYDGVDAILQGDGDAIASSDADVP
jgi:hypothetical protein